MIYTEPLLFDIDSKNSSNDADNVHKIISGVFFGKIEEILH